MIINKDNNEDSKILYEMIKNNIFLVTSIKNAWKIRKKRNKNLIIKILDINFLSSIENNLLKIKDYIISYFILYFFIQ